MKSIYKVFSFIFIVGLIATCRGQNTTPDDAISKANALLAKMTVDEKIGQLTQFFYIDNLPGTAKDPVSYEDHIRRGDVGSLLFVTDPATINKLQRIAMTEQRLHIPILFGFDVIHGFDTEFPVPIGMAASWDPSLAQKAQAVAAEEATANGVRWAFAPMLDIARDPRWGRISEGAGEDPYLGAAMARAQVIGFQGEPGTPRTFIATVKHFAGYGAAEGGRDYDASYIPEELLRNVYLPPFEAGVKAGAGTVMSAYMDLNDVPATGNTHLLQDILRDEWHFKGFVVSDAFAVADLQTHGFARDAKDAARRAALAGVNMDMGSGTYLSHLKELLNDGTISEAQLNNLVRPILIEKYRIGLFDHPYATATAQTYQQMLEKHRPLARLAAQRSAVLLRNQGNLLPLSKLLHSVAVIGPLGNSKFDINGPWSLSAKPEDSVTVFEGIKAKLPQAHVEFAPGAQIYKTYPAMFDGMIGPKAEPKWSADQSRQEMQKALDLASHADVVVMTLGEKAMMDFEYASRSSLSLPGQQQELLERVAALGKPVVLLLLSTRPLDLSWASEHVPAIMDCYFGGTEGGDAIADLLFGDAVPGGKLPVTWPRNVGQVPIYYAHNLSHKPYDAPGFTSRYWDLPTDPLYVFGYGLSYSTFSIDNLRLSTKSIPTSGSLTATVTVTNTGKRTADEVVQLYLHQRYGSASRPVRELKGFRRITLKPGQKQDVSFSVGPKERTYWSSAAKSWVNEPTDFDVWVGDDSRATLHDSFVVTP